MYGSSSSVRPRAETMPAVTVCPRPNGLPIAITASPTETLAEDPSFSAGRGAVVTFSNAMSGGSIRTDHFRGKTLALGNFTCTARALTIT